MIYVDVFVPVINREFDFILDENATVGMITDELIEVIMQNEKCKYQGPLAEIMLCLEETKSILPHNKTLDECGVHTGSKLILA